ncbi:MAG: trypsin-like peptidase domain-containing protein, partial [Gemmataceae bacterium]
MTGWLAASIGLLAIAWQGDVTGIQLAQEVNPKLVKLFGSGGFKGLPSYGTGVIISQDGYVLTVANHLLESSDLRVHLYDGTRLPARVIAVEPELDVALLKLGTEKSKIEDLPFYDVLAAMKAPLALPGTTIFAFSNQFQ